jgi:YfiH family protein
MITQPYAPVYRIPSVFAPFNSMIAAESTRHGGVSPAPFASLNLGINTDDDPANVKENRQRFFCGIGADTFGFASSHQVHSIEVLNTDEAGRFDGYDALITNRPGLLVGVTVADCVPILIYDSEHRAVAAIHAGWRGTVGGIVTRVLSAMHQQFGTLGAQCYAYVGTCIDETTFEVGEEVAGQFEPTFVQVNPHSQKRCANLKAANVSLLNGSSIPAAQIEVSSFSTVLNNSDYFSHRAEGGQTGRMLAVIGMHP